MGVGVGVHIDWHVSTETAIIDFHLSFADQGNQTSVSVCSKQTEVRRFRFPFAKETEIAVFRWFRFSCVCVGVCEGV